MPRRCLEFRRLLRSVFLGFIILAWPRSLHAVEPKKAGKPAEATSEKEVNHPPVLAAIGPKQIDEGKTLIIDVSATDVDENRFELTAEPLPAGAAFEDHDNGTGRFTWPTRFDQSGDYTVVFSAAEWTGDSPLSAKEQVTITVREAERVISGTIMSTSTGHPAAGVTIEVSTPTAHLKDVTTDQNGYFVIRGLQSNLVYKLRPTYSKQQLTGLSSVARKIKPVSFTPPFLRVTVTSKQDLKGNDFTGNVP